MSTEPLGDLIRARRNEMGMTQARLADLVGVSSSTLSAWERGQSEPDSEDAKIALAAVLGIGDSLTLASGSNSEGPSHLDHQSAGGTDGVPERKRRRRRGRRLRLEADATGPPSSGDSRLPEDGDYEAPSFGEWLRRFEPPEAEARKRTPEPGTNPGTGPMSGVGDTDLASFVRDADPQTGLGESAVLSTIKEADPWGSVRDSELVATVKDRITGFLRPVDEPDDTGSDHEPAEESVESEDMESTHSLTEDVYFEPSYVEDPDEMDHYRNRWIITAFVVIVLLMVAFWSLGQAQAALSDGWERMFNMLNF